MSEPLAAVTARSGTVHEKMAEATKGLGGFLQCLTCGHRMNLSNIGRYYRDGWPRCCGYTMRWWTQRQIDAGEVAS